MGLDQQSHQSEHPEDKSGPEKHIPADNRSMLDYVLQRAVDPVTRLVISNEKTRKQIDDGAKDFLKVAPLFMHGRLAIVGTLATYMADEIKQSDHGSEIAVDAALGAAKAGSLLATQKWLGRRNTTPSLMGVEMGIVNRAADTGFTRQNYYDSKGNFDLQAGLDKTAAAAASSTLTDFTTFGAADALFGKLYLRSRGAVTFNPVFTSALTASTFNVTTAAGAEVSHQIHDGKFDAGALLGKSLEAAAIGAAAGSLAGLQRKSALSTGIIDSPTALTEARSTPFQKGEFVDAAQAALKEGKFVAEKTIPSYNNLTVAGKVVHADGSETPAIFRATNGNTDFAHRQQSEIGAYGLSSMMHLPSEKFPTTVAKTAEIDGVQVDGFLQEMKGENFKHHYDKKQSSGEIDSAKQAVIKDLRENTELLKQLHSSWAERLIFGEWDNHSLNKMLLKKDGIKSFNIDLGDGFRPASTTLDHVPHPGLRASFDSINTYVYRELARTKFDPAITADLKRFVESKDTVEGRKEIAELGFTPQQVDGIIGRARWLAENGRLPRGNQTPTFTFLERKKNLAKRGARMIKNKLIGGNSKAQSAEQTTAEQQPDEPSSSEPH
jgi:hypothetical protein